MRAVSTMLNQQLSLLGKCLILLEMLQSQRKGGGSHTSTLNDFGPYEVVRPIKLQVSPLSGQYLDLLT